MNKLCTIKLNREKVYEEMANKCFRVRDLVERSGLSEPTVRKMLRGYPARLKSVGRLCMALGVSASDLMEAAGRVVSIDPDEQKDYTRK